MAQHCLSADLNSAQDARPVYFELVPVLTARYPRQWDQSFGSCKGICRCNVTCTSHMGFPPDSHTPQQQTGRSIFQSTIPSHPEQPNHQHMHFKILDWPHSSFRCNVASLLCYPVMHVRHGHAPANTLIAQPCDGKLFKSSNSSGGQS